MLTDVQYIIRIPMFKFLQRDVHNQYKSESYQHCAMVKLKQLRKLISKYF